ncbi:hypothetical protein GQ457_01G013190 [Hibiscus cannabinus]
MHISTILSRLPSEYEPVVVVITSSQQMYTLDGVCGVLFYTEARQQEAHLFNLVQTQGSSVGCGTGFYQSPVYLSPNYVLDRPFSGYVAKFLHQICIIWLVCLRGFKILEFKGRILEFLMGISTIVRFLTEGMYGVIWVEDHDLSASSVTVDSNLVFGASQDLSGSVALFSGDFAQVVSDDVDLQTCRVMLRGLENDGLYTLSSTASFNASSFSGQQYCSKTNVPVTCYIGDTVSCVTHVTSSVASNVCKKAEECCNALSASIVGGEVFTASMADLEVQTLDSKGPSSAIDSRVKFGVPRLWNEFKCVESQVKIRELEAIPNVSEPSVDDGLQFRGVVREPTSSVEAVRESTLVIATEPVSVPESTPVIAIEPVSSVVAF